MSWWILCLFCFLCLVFIVVYVFYCVLLYEDVISGCGCGCGSGSMWLDYEGDDGLVKLYFN